MEEEKVTKKPFVSVYWRCCHLYSRIYRNKKESAYEGRCPRCGGFLTIPIGKGGTKQRAFVAE